MLLKLMKLTMKPIFFGGIAVGCLGAALPLSGNAQTRSEHPYQYFRTGAATDVAPRPMAGFALMGGGTDLDEAFRWLCTRADGGDFLILRASGDDDYNPYVQKLCPLNSVATLILPSRAAAQDPLVAETIAHAEAIFIAGGDQANYIRYWTGTPVQEQLNAAIKRGVPLGGTSAGLAVMGEWVYSAEGDKPGDPNLDSATAMMNPMGLRITLAHEFLDIPILKHVITDTHFVRRKRMGRLLVFMALIQGADDPQIRGVGVDEQTAVLLEPTGKAMVVGKGTAAFLSPLPPAPKIETGKPLNRASFDLQTVPTGGSFDFSNWCCAEANTARSIGIEAGELRP
ncbi:cyanophycinase [Acidicapsa dinghuensis]|uniref:Cyanophycinase n=1 Tax=Acidicapsa dinghuensis TaxID=2218256 RepID=A0ABW1EKZ5_9BACT|nr:cyanophycinase [Acidicapsa dinghuensis]